MSLRMFACAFVLFLLALLTGCARETAAEHKADQYAAHEIAAAPIHGNLPDYSLPPGKLAIARRLSADFIALHFGAIAWNIAQLVLLLWVGAVAWMRDRAVAMGRNAWVQGYTFVFLFLLARAVLNLPLSMCGHAVLLHYGLSVQRWPGWFADLAKGLAVNVVVIGLLAVLLVLLVRRSPRWWWLWASAAAVPVALLGLYLTPIAIDPLFNHFEPLQAAAPRLSAQLAGMGVPASRQFLMRASAKVTTPNAYVTGFGPSKRIVVWDTSLGKGNGASPGVLWMVGHESGHFVLGHVLRGTLMALLAVPLALFLCFWFVKHAIARFGRRWRIGSQSDWGMLAVLWLAYALLSVPAEPVSNIISRHIEHDADIYGQEAIYGLVPDPQTAAKTELDEDGLRSLDDPNPAPLVEFWTYTHPATGRRAAFAAAYYPWAQGTEPKFFKK